MSKPQRYIEVYDGYSYRIADSKNDGVMTNTGLLAALNKTPTLSDIQAWLAEQGLETVCDLRGRIERAHMAGQADAGVDPGYSNARVYYDGLIAAQGESDE